MLPDQLCINVKRRAYDGSKYIIRNIFTYFRIYIPKNLQFKMRGKIVDVFRLYNPKTLVIYREPRT